MQSAKSLLAVINKEFGTLPFCRRYLDRAGANHHLLGVRARLRGVIFASVATAHARLEELPFALCPH